MTAGGSHTSTALAQRQLRLRGCTLSICRRLSNESPYGIQPYTPSVCPKGQTPPPTRREAAPRRKCAPKPSPAYRGWPRRGPGVEGTRYDLSGCLEICYAPHPSALAGCHLLPREKAFLCPGRLLRRFHPLKHPRLAGGACHRPYTQNRSCLPPLIRPLCGHLPQGKAFFAPPGDFPARNRTTPRRGNSLRGVL